MKTDALTRTALTAMLAVAAALGAYADDPVYVTGAEYEVSNEWLIVKSGDGTLVEPFDKKDNNGASRILIAQGASLTLGIDQPFDSSRPVLYVGGTFDLNGHSIRALRLFNDAGSNAYDINDLRSVPGRIINSSATGVTLTFESQNNSYFYGSIEECPGTIDITSAANGDFVVKSPVCTNTISSITVTGSKGVLRPETMPTIVTFVFRPPADSTKPIKLGEIELTCQGKTIQTTSKTVTTSSKDSSDPNVMNINLIDGKANTYWAAAEAGEQTVVIKVTQPVQIDGYRISPYGADNKPTGWDVYVSREKEGWKSFLVDSKRDFQWYSRRPNSSSTNLLFSADVRLGNILGTNTAVTLSNTVATPMEVSTIAPVEIKSLSGSGQVLLRHGTVFGPGDISGFTGQFTYLGTASWTMMAYLTLNAHHGAEQQFTIAQPYNLAVVNGGEAPVSVLLDDSRAGQNLFGKLADGEKGTLGLVKRGSGERIIETEDASYTGSTVVHEGTLTVARKRSPVTARYIKITPTAVYGPEINATAPWGMNEFRLLDAEGELMDWPQTPMVTSPGTAINAGNGLSKLTDGDTKSRMLLSPYSDGFAPVIIDMKTSVTFASYKWWTAHNHSQDKSRMPTAWTIEISNDKVAWTVCDNGECGWTDDDEAGATAGWTTTGENSVARGPFYVGSAQSTGTGLYTLPSDFFADGTTRDTHRKLKSQYFMLRVLETANPENTQNSFGWELAEICLYKDGERVEWPADTTIASAGGVVFSSNNSRLTNLVNNIVWEPNGSATGNDNAERTFIGELPSFVVINAHQVLEFDSYAFVSTSRVVPYTDRIPKAWTFSVSRDNSSNDSYTIIDSVGTYMPGTDYSITQNYQLLGPFNVASKYPILDTTAANSIGDESPVAISNNATLKIDADYEKFGPLSGAGTLDLVLDAVGEINAYAPATFSGSVTGRGTLAVCGDSVQTFDGATLSGVKTLELNGGAITGTASFSGNDVTVAFNGGATRAALSGIGTLTVTNDVKYAVPDVTGIESYSATLFTATNIPAASKALLEAGEIVNASRKWKWSVSVSDTSVVLRGNRIGLIFLIK